MIKKIKEKYDIVFLITGDYLVNFRPVVGMSRNMVFYERDIWKEIKEPNEIIRSRISFKMQQKCLNNAKGYIIICN